MSRRLALTGLLALAGCGFAPVYGTSGAGRALWGRVSIETPDSADGFAFRQNLQDRLGLAGNAAFRLVVTPSISQSAVAVGSDNSATRQNLIGQADYALLDGAGNVVTSGTVDSFVGYSSTATTVATRAAERDARGRLLGVLSDLIVARLIAVADELPAG